VLCVTDEERNILPRSPKKNQLHEALEKERYEDASRRIASNSEADLVECFESLDGSCKSCLHVIAGTSDTEQATKLCTELMQRIRNTKNRQCIPIDTTTVGEFDMVGWKVRARVAAIHIAAYSGNSGVVRLLCQQYGVDVNCSTSETLVEYPQKGLTALGWTAVEGHTEVVKVLLDNKADVNASTSTEGATPLYTTSQKGHTQVVKLILDNKADVNARLTNDGTPLHIASYNGHTQVTQLLDNKADVNASTHIEGITPLHITAWKGRTEVVKLLLGNKADVNACRGGGLGDKPIDAARRNRHLEIVKLLK